MLFLHRGACIASFLKSMAIIHVVSFKQSVMRIYGQLVQHINIFSATFHNDIWLLVQIPEKKVYNTAGCINESCCIKWATCSHAITFVYHATSQRSAKNVLNSIIHHEKFNSIANFKPLYLEPSRILKLQFILNWIFNLSKFSKFPKPLKIVALFWASALVKINRFAIFRLSCHT